MKKIINTFLIINLFFMFFSCVHAQTYALNTDDVKNNEAVVPAGGLVIGTYLFTDSAKASTELIMYATRSVVEDKTVIYQKFDDNDDMWFNALSGDQSLPNNVNGLICITHVDGVELDDKNCNATIFNVKFTGTDDSQDKNITVKNGEKIPSSAIPTPLTKNGYKYICWIDEDEVEEFQSSEESCFKFGETITKNVNLKPYYEPINYKIKYDLGDFEAPSFTDKEQTCNIDDFRTCELKTITDNRDGYTFVGWSTNSHTIDSGDGSLTTYYAPGPVTDLLKDNNVITLYAVWKPRNYTITYNLNGGTYNEQLVIKANFTDLTKENIKLFTPTRLGHTLKGWKIADNDDDSKGTISESGDLEKEYTLTIKKLENITLNAEWDAKSYTVNYDLGDVRPEESLTTPSATTCKFDENCQLEEAPSREDYDFGGWKDTNGYVYAAKKDFKGVDFAGDTVNLTAIWFAKNEPTYTITYNLKDGYFKSTPISKFGRKDKEEALPTNPVKTGYTFKGWCKGSTDDCSESYITKISQALDSDTLANIEVTAVWEANKYTIKLKDSETVLETISCTYDSEDDCTLALSDQNSNHFKEKHQTLLGWSLVYGSDKVYLANNIKVKNLTTTPNGELELYAVAKNIKYTITYYLDGGKFDRDEAPTSVTENEKVTIPTPKKTGYTFVKWVDKDGKDIPLEESDKLTVTEDKFMVAVWKSDEESRVLFDFPNDMKANKEVEFRVGSEANEHAGEMVIAKVTLTEFQEDSEGTPAKNDISNLQYCAQYDETGNSCTQFLNFDMDENGVAYFGPKETGFPLSDLTSIFKVTFNKKGVYKVKIEMMKFDTSPENSTQALVTKEIIIEVKDATE